MAEGNGKRNWFDYVSFGLSTLVVPCVAWGVAIQRQADTTAIRQELSEKAGTTKAEELNVTMTAIRVELSALREIQSRNYQDIVQRLSRVEARVENR